MADRLASTYDPKEYESKWWKFWTDNKFFNSTPDKSKKPYTILMPPPNITSQLHMGHGTCYTFQDLLIRWKRMCGYNACWLPGTDHAGIATQMMVEKDLYNREKKTKGVVADIERQMREAEQRQKKVVTKKSIQPRKFEVNLDAIEEMEDDEW